MFLIQKNSIYLNDSNKLPLQRNKQRNRDKIQSKRKTGKKTFKITTLALPFPFLKNCAWSNCHETMEEFERKEGMYSACSNNPWHSWLRQQ